MVENSLGLPYPRSQQMERQMTAKTEPGRLEVTTAMTPADMEATIKFIGKRVRRHRDAVDGFNASLFGVMLVVGRGLSESGMPLESVSSVFDQMKEQVCTVLRNGGAA